MHGGGHVVKEIFNSFFFRMDGCEEAVLLHVLRQDGGAYHLRMSCKEVSEAFTVGMGLCAEGGGAEGVLSPLLYPVFRGHAVFFGIAYRLHGFVEGFAYEAVSDA